MSAVSSPAGLRTMTEYTPSSWRSAPSMVKMQWPLVLSTWTRPSESVSTWSTNQNHLLKNGQWFSIWISHRPSHSTEFSKPGRQLGIDHGERSNIILAKTLIDTTDIWNLRYYTLPGKYLPLAPMNGRCLPIIFKLYTLWNQRFTHLVDTVFYRVVCVVWNTWCFVAV